MNIRLSSEAAKIRLEAAVTRGASLIRFQKLNQKREEQRAMSYLIKVH
jgi:hypothetical protein